MLSLFLAANTFLVYQLIRYLYRTYGNKLTIYRKKETNIDRVVPYHQLCIVCYNNARSVIFKPCKHYGVCYGCYKRINKCPICKEPIHGIIQISLK